MSTADLIARTRAAHGQDCLPDYAVAIAAREVVFGNVIACRTCHQKWPASLIDAKPEPDQDDGDFTYLQCPPCYGPGWSCL